MYKFRNLNNSKIEFGDGDQNKSDLQTVFDSYLAIASNSPFLLIFALSFSQHLKRLNETAKNCAAFIMLLIVFTVITVFVLIDTDKCK